MNGRFGRGGALRTRFTSSPIEAELNSRVSWFRVFGKKKGQPSVNQRRSQTIQRYLRILHLLPIAEKIRYVACLARNHRSNRDFISANPNFRLPLAALAYDAYSAPDWVFYSKSGIETAAFLAGLVKKYIPQASFLKILEWGCGPARVIRHIAPSIGNETEVFGSDYNAATVAWCKENIPNVRFVPNLLDPPLPLDDGYFDFIYAISVLTHLSESVCKTWISELLRVARPGGIIVLTTNGDSMQMNMSPGELRTYREDGVLIRDNVQEGKRCFLAAYSPQHAREHLFEDLVILEHVPAAFPFTGQDYWVLKKPDI